MLARDGSRNASNQSLPAQSAILYFEAAPCTHIELKQQVDLVASALLSLADLNLEESIVCAKEGRTQWPRALFLVKQQGVAEYTVALLACLKIGLEVVLINSSQTQESDYVAKVLGLASPYVLFVDESVDPRFYTSHRTIPLKSNSTTSPSTLRILAESEATKSSLLREEKIARHRSHLREKGWHDQPAIAVMHEGTSQLYQASHGSIIAGILSCHNLFSRADLYLNSETSFSSALPLHVVSHLTLSLFCPLYLDMTSYIYPPETCVEHVLSGNQDQTVSWLTSHQANLLYKRLSKQDPAFKPRSSCIAILQPGMGSKSQDILASILPKIRLMNVYSPPQSTGLLCLADQTTFGLHLGLPEASHRVTILDRWTDAILPPDQQGKIIVKGPMMMKPFDCEDSQFISQVDVNDDLAVMRQDGSLQLAYGSSIMDPRTFLEDHITTHPKVTDCSVLLVQGHLRAFVSVSKSDLTVAQDISLWAAQAHSYFTKLSGTVSIVKTLGRSTLGYVDTKWLMNCDVLSSSTPVSSGPKMGFFLDHTAQPSTTCTPRSIRPSKKVKAAASDPISKAPSIKGTASITETVSAISSTSKKPIRDSKRRATHSQIERRRREKINDRLVTLRTLVPACAAEIEERKRQKLCEEEESRRIAAGEMVAKGNRGKRKRNRRKIVKAEEGGDKEDELGMHKLEVLTFTIDYIYELQERIRQLSGKDTATSKRMMFKKRAALEIDDDDNDDEDDKDDDDKDEDGSDANLEMSDWKPSVKRTPIEFTNRHSTASSGSSCLAVSPSVMSLSAESPMFSTRTLSSASVFSNLTSPMMSLSSESPILRWSNQSASSLISTCEKEERASVKKKNVHSIDWQLPAPALPFEDKQGSKANITTQGSSSNPNIKAPSDIRGSSTSSSAQEAHLLLSLSTSPEIFRPVSAIRKTYNTDNHLRRQRSMTVVCSGSKTSSSMSFQNNRIGESAPGGAHPSRSNVLVSPPLLALDDPSFSVSQNQNTTDGMQVVDK